MVSALIFFVFFQTPPVAVRTINAQDVTFHQRYEVTAQVVARWDSEISSEISAVVEAVQVEVGDYVEQGSPLLQLDCRTYDLNLQETLGSLQEAQARLELASLQLDRSQTLVDDAIISVDLHSQRVAEKMAMEAVVLTRQAQWQTAQLQVEKCRVAAPFSGYITERNAHKGQWTTVGQPLVRLVQADRPSVSVRLTESQSRSVEQGVNLRFHFNQESHSLALIQISPIFDSKSRTAEARLRFTDKPLAPGVTGVVTWESVTDSLPPSLLVKRGSRLGVMVVDGDKAQFIAIANAVEGRAAEIDLPPQTQIIDEGRLGLQDGDTIQVR